jgi:hypothetical protein
MSDLSGIIALAERAARYELLVEIYERETSALLEKIRRNEMVQNVKKEKTEFTCIECGEPIEHIFYGSADSVCGSYESTDVCYECCKADIDF